MSYILLVSYSLSESCIQILGNLVNELESVEVLAALWGHRVVNADSQVLSHVASLDGLDDDTLACLAPVLQSLVVVELGTVEQTTSPGEHRGDRVGGGLTAFLVHTVVSCDCAVGSLSLNRAIGALKHRGHETERTVTLGNNIGLDITVVVLAGPDESTVGLDCIGDHIIDKTVLVPETGCLELRLVISFVDFLEDILEAAVVPLQDSVLRGQVAWVVSAKSVLHTSVGEAID